MAALAYATRITIRERGDFLVERLCENAVVDRYTCSDLAAPRRNREPWIQAVVAIFSQYTNPSTVAARHDLGDTIAAAVAAEVQP